MDSVSKRQTALALFVALQSWKLYDWLIDLPRSLSNLNGTGSGDVLDDLLAFIFKWTALELVFLAGLNYVRVPKLVWSLSTRMMMYGMLCCMTLGMAFFAPALIPGPKSIQVQSSLHQAAVDDVAGSRQNLIRGISNNQPL